jgi:hypothetical protein
MGHTGGVRTDGGFAYLAWPIVVLLGFGVMVLFLRWTFSSGHSLIERRPEPGRADEYGLLVPVASPPTYIEGEQVRLELERNNIRASLVTTTEGLRIMVFENEKRAAEAVLRS